MHSTLYMLYNRWTSRDAIFYTATLNYKLQKMQCKYNHTIKYAIRKTKYKFSFHWCIQRLQLASFCGFSACYWSETWNLVARLILSSLIDALIADRIVLVCAADVLRSCPVVPLADADEGCSAFLPATTASSCAGTSPAAGGFGLPAAPRFMTVVFQTQYKNSVIVFTQNCCEYSRQNNRLITKT